MGSVATTAVGAAIGEEEAEGRGEGAAVAEALEEVEKQRLHETGLEAGYGCGENLMMIPADFPFRRLRALTRERRPRRACMATTEYIRGLRCWKRMAEVA